MSYKLFCHAVNARHSPVRIRVQYRELLIKAFGKVQQDLAGIPFHDILVIKNPVSSRRGFLLQSARSGQIRIDLTQMPAGLFEAFK